MEDNIIQGPGGGEAKPEKTMDELVAEAFAGVTPEPQPEEKQAEQVAVNPAEDKTGEQVSSSPANKDEKPVKELTEEEKKAEGLKNALIAERKKRQELQTKFNELVKVKVEPPKLENQVSLSPEYQKLYEKYREVDPDMAELRKEEWLIQAQHQKKAENTTKISEHNSFVYTKEVELYNEIKGKYPDVDNPESDLYRETSRLLNERPDTYANDFYGHTKAVIDAAYLVERLKETRDIDTNNKTKINNIKKIMDTQPDPSGEIKPKEKEKTYDELLTEAINSVRQS